MQFLGAIKKWQVRWLLYKTKKWRENPPYSALPSPKQNRSESQCSCIIQELMNRGKYAHLSLRVKHAFIKSSGVSKITPVRSKNQRITVSVFLSTLQLTALLLEKFRLRLHGMNSSAKSCAAVSRKCHTVEAHIHTKEM